MIFYFIIFLFGLAVGSFLNCVIYRLEKKKSFFKGRSYCPHCKHVLSWRDLVPLFSFLLLKRRCRHCQKKISWQYPLVELATGFLFLSIVNFQNLIEICFLLLISCFLIVIFVYDLKYYIIPNKVIYPAIAIAFLYRLFEFLKSGVYSPFVAAFAAAAFFLVIILISRGKWMGLGDVKLAFFMGLFLGYPNVLVALFLAFFIGAIIGVGLILAGKKTLKSEVPFGPFLIIGTFIALFWGEVLVNWYLNFIS